MTLQRLRALQGPEALLADIIEEEMAHLDTGISPVPITSYNRLKKLSPSQSVIRYLSTLMEKQQAILEKVQEQQSRVAERYLFLP